MSKLLKQLRMINESDAESDVKCNKSAKGKYCPKHKMDECSMVSEDDQLPVDSNDGGAVSDGPKPPEPDAAPALNNAPQNKGAAGNDEVKVDDDGRGVEDNNAGETSEEDIKRQDDEYYKAIKGGGKIPEEVVEPDRFMRYYEATYGVDAGTSENNGGNQSQGQEQEAVTEEDNEEDTDEDSKENKKVESNSIYNEARGGSDEQFKRNKDHWLVQSLKNGEADDHEMFPPNQKDKALALAKKLRDEGHKGVKVVHPSKESFNENISIQVDQQDAYELIRRMAELAGQPPITTVQAPSASITGMSPEVVTMEDDREQEHCPHCGREMGGCICSNDNDYDPQDNELDSNYEMRMAEDIDNDFGHTDHPDAGEPVDPNTYLYRAPNGAQRTTKARGGDNALINNEIIKEDAGKLFTKLKKDYRAYVAEADLAASNAPGALSPLSASSRDEFVKDPFADDESVTDGSRSPLSTIKRQSVAK
jgi:hypothetical protein